MGHEIGQWTFFPNFDEIAKYTGVLQAKNFELVRDDLAKKHLLDLAPQFVQATGRHAVLLYKEEIEVLLRTPNYPGFSLLDLHDYPGQGTALIGPLDPFWDSKGFVTPQQHTRYCGPTVPLLRLKKRTFTSDETLTAEAEIAHFGARDLVAAMPEWSIRDEKGTVVAEDTLPPRDIPTGKLTPLGQIEASLAKRAAPGKLTISLSLPGTPIANEWEIWVYPPKVNIEPPKGLVVSKVWNDEVKSTLAHGGRVLLFATADNSQSLPGRFLPVFWSPVWFPTQKPNTMGILCDPRHPALADFPTDFYSNWQWYELLDHSRSIILDDTPAEFRPDRARDRQLRAESQAGRDLRGPSRFRPTAGLRHRSAGTGREAARRAAIIGEPSAICRVTTVSADDGIACREAGETASRLPSVIDAATRGKSDRDRQPGAGLRGGKRH